VASQPDRRLSVDSYAHRARAAVRRRRARARRPTVGRPSETYETYRTSSP
jgi:hypothetical protein